MKESKHTPGPWKTLGYSIVKGSRRHTIADSGWGNPLRGHPPSPSQGRKAHSKPPLGFTLLELLCVVAVVSMVMTMLLGPVSRGGKHVIAQAQSIFRYHSSRLDRASNLNLSSEETGYQLSDTKWP